MLNKKSVSIQIIRMAVLLSILSWLVLNQSVKAHGGEDDSKDLWRAEVLEVLEQEQRFVPGTEVETTYQKIRVRILEGERKEQVLVMDNDFFPMKKGNKFFLEHYVNPNGEETYAVQEIDRRTPLYFFIGLFILAVIFFGGKQGLRSLMSLAGSFFIIFYFILPRIAGGASPMVTSTVFSIIILILAIYITHGVNRKSNAALLGTIITILVTITLASLAVKITLLSGFADDASIYLNINTGGRLDAQGLLLGAVIIGVLGILDDIAITQASVVKELHNTAPHLSRKQVYMKALRLGKEHVGALVNTLALAYTGAAFPLLLIFYSSNLSPSMIINREVFSTEIIRTVVGSIGVILAVPITTRLATFLLIQKKTLAKKDTKG